MGGWHLDLSALKWAKKRAFLKIFDKIFFIFQKLTFFIKSTSWDCKNVSKKRHFFFENTPVDSRQDGLGKSEKWIFFTILLRVSFVTKVNLLSMMKETSKIFVLLILIRFYSFSMSKYLSFFANFYWFWRFWMRDYYQDLLVLIKFHTFSISKHLYFFADFDSFQSFSMSLWYFCSKPRS